MNHDMGLHGTHDPLLVGLSLTIAVLASYSALTIAGRLKTADRRGRLFWLGAAAVTLGGGIWSMHFVAMLAFSLGMPIDYHVGLTVTSLVAAIVVAGTALYVVGRWQASWTSLLVAGFFAGLGVATMHYMGMAAMRMDATISYDPLLFAVSIVIAVVAATAALWLAFNLEAAWHKVAAAFVMGAAIGGMHYTGMAATIYTPLTDGAMVSTSSISPYGLAFAIAAASVVIFGLGIAAALVDRRFTNQLERELVERRKIELELRDTNKHLQAAMDKLSTTERLATIGQIAATVSHELRNPLASIRTSMELVRLQTMDKGCWASSARSTASTAMRIVAPTSSATCSISPARRRSSARRRPSPPGSQKSSTSKPCRMKCSSHAICRPMKRSPSTARSFARSW